MLEGSWRLDIKRGASVSDGLGDCCDWLLEGGVACCVTPVVCACSEFALAEARAKESTTDAKSCAR